MKPNEIIKTIMKTKGFSNKTLADKLNKSTASAVSNPLLRPKGMRIDTFAEMVDAVGYKILIVPQEVQHNYYEVTIDTKRGKTDE